MINKSLKLIALLITSTLLFLYLWVAILHSNLVNTRTYTGEIDHGDQGAYIAEIKKVREQNFRYFGDRIRMPLYIYFQAIFHSDNMTDQQLFTQAKYINVLLSLYLLYLIYLFNRRYLSTLANITFTLIVGFSVFLPRASYVQPEILYFTISYFAFIYICKSFKNPTIKNAVIASTFSAFAYLTKASMLLSFGLFIIFLVLLNIKNDLWKKSVIIAGVSIALFLIIIFPYIIQTKKVYGSLFFNYATVYMWEDNWDKVLILDKSLQNIDLLKSTPKDLLPSPKKYLKEHTFKQVSLRLITGVALNIGILLSTYTSLSSSILIFYLLFLIYIIFSYNNGVFSRKYLKINNKLAIFVPAYFFLQFLAFSWYSPIGAGPRFLHPLYMPLLFSVFYLLEALTIKANQQGKFYVNNRKLFYLIHSLSVLILFLGIKIALIPALETSWAGF